MNLVPEEWIPRESWPRVVAGILGAWVSLNFLQGSIWARLSLAAGGSVMSFYAGPWVAHKIGVPEVLAGFMLGLLGMAITSRIMEFIRTVSSADVSLWIRGTVGDWFKRRPGGGN